MQNLWSDTDAEKYISDYAARGVGEDLALRVYTSRLIGSDPLLVAHGGGNTSVKTVLPDFLGKDTEVLCVKGSGWDLGDIEPEGLPAVELAPLAAVRSWDKLSDEDMVRFQRSNLLDPSSPNPSVETLLHAYLPHKFVDHSHASAVLSVVDQPNGIELAKQIFGDKVTVVPYIMPGFELAVATADAFDTNPDVEAIVLHKHGLFTFGDTAQESYDRMIQYVAMAEAHIAKAPAFVPKGVSTAGCAALADVVPVLRGACCMAKGGGAYARWILDHRASDAVRTFVDGADMPDYGTRGVITPDHIIRLKNKPLVVPFPEAGKIAEFKKAVEAAVAAYQAEYDRYFAENSAGKGKTQLDNMPRVIYVPGIGLFGMGNSAKAAAVAADLAEITITTVSNAERIGTYEALNDAHLFDMEYWSLEQAKLGKGTESPLQRQVALVTGGGGAIGAATAKLFAANGAEVAVLDLDIAKAQATADAIGGAALAIACDVTDRAEVEAAVAAVCARFGGVDIIVSNAGAAWQGAIGEMDDAVLRKSFELNFFSHQTVAQCAVKVMKAQGTGGALLFNASKQAVNPGKDFGAYGLPKAATLFLSRQYALEYGSEGIRSCAVNADRIRSGLLTDDMISDRSSARGLSEEDYLSGNLLGQEVTAEDVAQAFLHHALALKTTADVTTVDGGNISAAMR